jgi:hypothetical protein
MVTTCSPNSSSQSSTVATKGCLPSKSRKPTSLPTRCGYGWILDPSFIQTLSNRGCRQQCNHSETSNLSVHRVRGTRRNSVETEVYQIVYSRGAERRYPIENIRMNGTIEVPMLHEERFLSSCDNGLFHIFLGTFNHPRRS